MADDFMDAENFTDAEKFMDDKNNIYKNIFDKNIINSKFIVFEGLDGSGKSTQVKRLTNHFNSLGLKNLTTKEPTDGPMGKLAKRAVCGMWEDNGHVPESKAGSTVESKAESKAGSQAESKAGPQAESKAGPQAESKTPTPEALALLFAADRSEHIAQLIRPALESAGTYVLCDRYVYSNMAYQGMDIPIGHIAAYNIPFLIYPDLTIFIDTSPEECTRRILAARQHLEIYDGTETATKIREQYIKAFKFYGEYMPVVIIDGNLHEDEVFSRVLRVLREVGVL